MTNIEHMEREVLDSRDGNLAMNVVSPVEVERNRDNQDEEPVSHTGKFKRKSSAISFGDITDTLTSLMDEVEANSALYPLTFGDGLLLNSESVPSCNDWMSTKFHRTNGAAALHSTIKWCSNLEDASGEPERMFFVTGKHTPLDRNRTTALDRNRANAFIGRMIVGTAWQ
eukprot:103045-Rhodomonas_salina.2